jgi:hypothetical protein
MVKKHKSGEENKRELKKTIKRNRSLKKEKQNKEAYKNQ